MIKTDTHTLPSGADVPVWTFDDWDDMDEFFATVALAEHATYDEKMFEQTGLFGMVHAVKPADVDDVSQVIAVYRVAHTGVA